MESVLMASASATKASPGLTARKGLVRITVLTTEPAIKQLTNAIVTQPSQETTAHIKNAPKIATDTEYANSAYAIAPQNSQESAANTSSAPKTAAGTDSVLTENANASRASTALIALLKFARTAARITEDAKRPFASATKAGEE